MLILLIGILWMLKIENGILVLEDINEYFFWVECMLLQFYYVGILLCQKVIIFGSFSGSTFNDYDVGYNLELVYVFLCFCLLILFIIGFDFGYE